MHILLLAQYFWPESVGAGIWIHQLATDLVNKGHRVSCVTAFPNYPAGSVFDGYRGRLLMREAVDGVNVIRTYIYGAPREAPFRSRAANFGSFCASSILGGLLVRRPDVVYAILPPLPLGWSAELIGWFKAVPVVINIQDIYPDIAVSLQYLKNPHAIRFFRRMESKIYSRAAAITVIGEGFRENLMSKGVPPEKVVVVPNWADSTLIAPVAGDNSFRRRLNAEGRLLVVYSGGMGHNASLEVLVEAARALSDEPFQFVLVGDGPKRELLERLARGLTNFAFLPFQSLEVYPQILAASDLQIVSLNQQATAMSLPSKVLKIMSSARPVLALASPDSDLARLVQAAACGWIVNPDDREGLVKALQDVARNEVVRETKGMNGRSYLIEHFERTRCVGLIESLLEKVISESGKAGALSTTPRAWQ